MLKQGIYIYNSFCIPYFFSIMTVTSLINYAPLFKKINVHTHLQCPFPEGYKKIKTNASILESDLGGENNGYLGS